MVNQRARLGAIWLLAALGTACGDGSPTSADETFRVALTSADQVAAARSAHSGGAARIPVGRIVPGTQVNVGWSWHLEDLSFAEVTIELCDGRPSDVERAGSQFGGGQFCPWTATILRID